MPKVQPPAAAWWQVALEGGAAVLWVVGWLLWWLGWLLLLPWHLVRWANASGIENAGAMLTACYVILGVGGGLWLWLLPPVWLVHLLEVVLA